jgi:hypothetical protein
MMIAEYFRPAKLGLGIKWLKKTTLKGVVMASFII